LFHREINAAALHAVVERAGAEHRPVEVAADGAAVYNTLLATARTLRHAELSDARSQANEVSERMSRPLALLVFGLTAFVLVPFALRMFGAA